MEILHRSTVLDRQFGLCHNTQYHSARPTMDVALSTVDHGQCGLCLVCLEPRQRGHVGHIHHADRHRHHGFVEAVAAMNSMWNLLMMILISMAVAWAAG